MRGNGAGKIHVNARESRGHATRRKFRPFPRTSFESRACVHLSPNRVTDVTESLLSLSFWAESLGSTFPGNIDSWHSGLFKWCTWTWSYHHLIQNGDWRCFNTGDRGRRYWITISKRFVVLHTTTSNKQGFKEIESIVIRSCKFFLGTEKGKKKTSPLVQFYRLL